MLDYRIYTFMTLCETQSYTKAASKLCMTQPGVTQHIKFLENHFGTKLVERTSKGVQLTESGKLYYHYCLEMKSQSVAIEKRLAHQQNQPQKIEFGATLTIGEFILPQRIADYVADYPNQRITMRVDNTQKLLRQVGRGELDCAFIEGNFNQEAFTAQLLQREPFVMVASKHHRLSQMERVTLAALSRETLIVREEGSGTRDILENALRDGHYPMSNFKNILEVGNLGAIKQLVKAGIGYTMLYHAAVKEEILSGELVILPVETSLHLEKAFYLVYRNNSWREKDYLHLLEYAKKQ